MALEEINLRVIYALLQSDCLAPNLELEPRNPGRSFQMYISVPQAYGFIRILYGIALENTEYGESYLIYGYLPARVEV